MKKIAKGNEGEKLIPYDNTGYALCNFYRNHFKIDLASVVCNRPTEMHWHSCTEVSLYFIYLEKWDKRGKLMAFATEIAQ